MAFTPVTMPAGTILATNAGSQGVQDNLDKMRNYVDGGVVAADLATDNWVDSKHVMRGHYNSIVNMHSFVTGLNGGYASKTQEMSSINLFKCIVKIHYFNNNNNKSFFPGCDTKIYKAIYEEFNKRFFSPIFTINIGLIASLLLIFNKKNNN